MPKKITKKNAGTKAMTFRLLSGPLGLRVQLRSSARLRIAASIAFLFRTCFQRVLDTIAPLLQTGRNSRQGRPFGPKVGNGLENRFPGPEGPRAQNFKIRVEKESKKVKQEVKFPLFDSFSTTTFRPPELVFNSISNFGPKEPKNSSGGIEGSQP